MIRKHTRKVLIRMSIIVNKILHFASFLSSLQLCSFVNSGCIRVLKHLVDSTQPNQNRTHSTSANLILKSMNIKMVATPSVFPQYSLLSFFRHSLFADDAMAPLHIVSLPVLSWDPISLSYQPFNCTPP